MQEWWGKKQSTNLVAEGCQTCGKKKPLLKMRFNNAVRSSIDLFFLKVG
jgi:hypothetical protein